MKFQFPKYIKVFISFVACSMVTTISACPTVIGGQLEDETVTSNYNLRMKCPHFCDAYEQKNKDVCVVITGTSLSQGNLYTSVRQDADSRPPLMHGCDLASLIWDKISIGWDGQKYYRYDNEQLTYSTSTWEVTNDLVVNDVHIWDDRAQFHNGLTQTTIDGNAFVSVIVPEDAWQFNFIYRTDCTGSVCFVNIEEGNEKMEVYDGFNWVEANGYSFSMHESEPTITKGNTIYQKRLKMRCKDKVEGGINSIGTEKHLKISKANDASRMNVVGFEWSPREYMLTLINASRGSHQWGRTIPLASNDMSINNLEQYQDGDIWVFNPDLILAEVTLINWGASNKEGIDTYGPNYYVNIAKKVYFNELLQSGTLWNYNYSLYNKSGGYSNCEVIFYGDNAHGKNFGNWNVFDEDGSPKYGDGYETPHTFFDNWYAVDDYMLSKEDYIYIPTISTFKDVAETYYGSYYNGMQASGVGGNTLSYDGIHFNDNGAALWASMILPLFNPLTQSETVDPLAKVVLTATSSIRDYGEKNPKFDYTSEGAEFIGEPEIICEATESSPVGEYPIVIKKGNIKNFNDTYVNGVLTVTKAPLNITAKSYSIKQGEALPTFEVEYSAFKNNETNAVLTKQPVISCEATSASVPGEYPIIVSGAEAQNYEISYVSGTLTITEADPVKITAKSYTREYGEDNPSFEYSVEGAEMDGTPEIICEATTTSSVGEYPIVIKKGSVTNYNDTYVNGVLKVTKAPLSITAKSYSIKQGETLPTFEVEYSAFKNNETNAVLTKQPKASCEATSASAPGEYPITASDAEALNYTFTYINGILTITESDSQNIKSIKDVAQMKVISIYSLEGRKRNTLQHGVNIVKLEGGAIRKVIIK